MARTLTLQAPVSGMIISLDQVPDPVFAQKMMGEGVAVDPMDTCLRAPCDGLVQHMHGAGHAVTLVTEGLEILLHVGLDTVNLKGRGFTPMVISGSSVKKGDVLIEFDLETLLDEAKSVLILVVITNAESIAELTIAQGMVQSIDDELLTAILSGEKGQEQGQDGQPTITESVVVINREGLHARPAAVLANRAKQFQSEIRVLKGDQAANAKSITGILTLAVNFQDTISLQAVGNDADNAVAELSRLVSRGLGEEGTEPVAAPASITVEPEGLPVPQREDDRDGRFHGIAASPGQSSGKVFQWRRSTAEFAEQIDGDIAGQRQRLFQSIEQCRGELDALQLNLQSRLDSSKAAIFAAHQELLEDPDLLAMASNLIEKGKTAEFAWQQSVDNQVQSLSALDNALLAERAVDLQDVGQRVLGHLVGHRKGEIDIPEGALLIAEELTPSDTAGLDPQRVAGVATVAGGSTSHVAILARSLGIPAVVGLSPKILEMDNDGTVIINGDEGWLQSAPDEQALEQVKLVNAQRLQDDEQARSDRLLPALTRDEERILVKANIDGLGEEQKAADSGAEGVGLLRSEFLFMGRNRAPDESEQEAAYRAVVEAFGKERQVLIRTLDVGGDKPLSYLPMAHEDNPFLGERGLRLCLNRPELFRSQVRAIHRVAASGQPAILLPMVTSLSELQTARQLIAEECAGLGLDPLPVGIMVEVPAAAILAETFASHVDFFSIGSNDLTQYVLAMDRGHPKLAGQSDPLHPAVLTLIDGVVQVGRRFEKPVSICGGIAGDLQALPLLIGLDVRELSVPVPAVAQIKAAVRGLDSADCRDLARQALRAESAQAVWALLQEFHRMTGEQ